MADSFTVEINDKIAPSIAQKLDAIAKASGASSDAVDALKKQINTIGKGPIDSLEAAVKAATNSIDAEGKAVNKLTSELTKLDVQTRKAANAAGTFKKEFTGFRSDQLANIGFQLQDIIVSLQGGQKPLTVFLQQGGQIGQVFGQAGASATQGLGAIGRIIVSFINPLTIVLGLFVAAGVAIYSFVSFRSDIDDLSKRLGTSAQSTEALYKSLYKISGLSIADQNKELTSIGLALNKAANDPENDLNERFKKNGLSITDAVGKLKPFEQNMKSIVALIQNAKSEFDAIDIASQVGASQELATSLYRAKEGLGDLKSDAKDALDPLQKSAADFDRNAAEYWRNFVLYAKSAIQEVGKFLYDLLNNLPTDPIGTLVTKAIGAVKGAPGAIGKAIGEMNAQPYGPIGVVDRIGGNSRKVGAQNFQDRFNGGLVGDVDSALAKGLQAKADALNGKKAPREVLPTGKTTDNSKIEKEKKPKKPKFDVEEDINIKLDQQIARLKLLRPERELQQQLDEIDNKLRRQGKTLNDEERAAITAKVTEIERLKGVQREMDAIYDSTVGIQEKYNNTLDAANNLLSKGVINQDQYSKAVGDAKIKVNEASNTIGAGVENGLLKTVQEYGNTTSAVSSTVTRSFDGLADGLASFASNSKFSFSDLSRSILADVTKMIIRIAVLKPLLSSLTGGGSSLGSIFSGGAGLDLSGGLNLLGGAVPGLPTFATGGDIKVGGNGGTDSQTVAFRASPNETVSIRRPGQSAGGEPVKVEVNNYGSNTQAEVQRSPNGRGGVDIKVLVKDIESRIAQGISTGTSPVAKASQQRYGLDPARGAR